MFLRHRGNANVFGHIFPENGQFWNRVIKHLVMALSNRKAGRVILNYWGVTHYYHLMQNRTGTNRAAHKLNTRHLAQPQGHVHC